MSLLHRRRTDSCEPPPPALRVLIADDDENFLAYMVSLVRKLGCNASSAADGTEALALLERETFDLLLTDFDMPRLDGFELIRRVRSTPKLSTLYSVMLTSHSGVKCKIAALNIGFDDFLTKNCEEIELLAKLVAVRRVLARQQALNAEAREWHVLATRDELTSVASRREFFACATACLDEGRAIGIALFDLDGFKQINDIHGHLAGDTILRDIGSCFLRCTRHNDLVGRYGGDEFVMMVPDLGLDDVIAATKRIVGQIEDLSWDFEGKIVRMGITAGISHSSLLRNAELTTLLDVADRQLYSLKWLRNNPPQASDQLYEYGQRGEAAIVKLSSDTPDTPATRVKN